MNSLMFILENLQMKMLAMIIFVRYHFLGPKGKVPKGPFE